VVSTAVPRVCLNYRSPEEQPIHRMTVADANRYLSKGQFGEGSMGPKIRSAVRYLEQGGRRRSSRAPTS